MSTPDAGSTNVNQPMRLAALAGALVQTGRYDKCRTVLTVPTGHRSMRRRWAESTEMLSHTMLGVLEPAMVLALLEDDRKGFLASRYGIEINEAEWADWTDSLGWVLASELLARHPDSFRVIETHPFDGFYDCLTIVPVRGEGRIDINRVRIGARMAPGP